MREGGPSVVMTGWQSIFCKMCGEGEKKNLIFGSWMRRSEAVAGRKMRRRALGIC